MASNIIERSIIGELVFELTEEGFRVELCVEDGSGLYLYAVPNGDYMPDRRREYWLLLSPGNGVGIIVDYSLNLEPFIQKTIKLGNDLEGMDNAR